MTSPDDTEQQKVITVVSTRENTEANCENERKRK